MSTKQKLMMPAATLAAHVTPDSPQLLTPRQVSELLGLSLKWLANAREGRGTLPGPPYIKLGNGRTAPVRYKLTSVIAWLAQFPEVMNTAGATPALYRSLVDYEEELAERPTAHWLYAVDIKKRELYEFFSAVNAGAISAGTRLKWLANDELPLLWG